MWHWRCTPSRPATSPRSGRSKRTTSLRCSGSARNRSRPYPADAACAGARSSQLARFTLPVVGHARIVAADALGSPVDWTLATIAVALLAFAAVSGRVDGTPSPPAIAVRRRSGSSSAPRRSGSSSLSSHGESVKLLAEATLTVVLFADASRIDLRALRREIAIPARLLGIGLPLTLVAGLVGRDRRSSPISPGPRRCSSPSSSHRPTQRSVRPSSRSRGSRRGSGRGSTSRAGSTTGSACRSSSSPSRSPRPRRARSATAPRPGSSPSRSGTGILAGAIAGGDRGCGRPSPRAARRRRTPPGSRSPPSPGPLSAYGIATPIGGSGFIAAFVGGMVFGGLLRGRAEEVGKLLDEAGAVLGAVTFVVFGAVLLGPSLGARHGRDRRPTPS